MSRLFEEGHELAYLWSIHHFNVCGSGLAQSKGSGIDAGAKPAQIAPRFSCEIALLKLASYDRCIEVVAEAGYQGVELTGYFQQWTAEEQRRLLAKMHTLE